MGRCASPLRTKRGTSTLRIEDDGRGLDVDRIRKRHLPLGSLVLTNSRIWPTKSCAASSFRRAFSTAKNVTNVSGRGVGMDVVRENIESIGGAVTLSTSRGRGTTFILKVPLTLAIAPALIFEVEGQRFAIPQHAVVEAVTAERVARVHPDGPGRADAGPSRSSAPSRGHETIFGFPSRSSEKDCLAIVARTGVHDFALTVDNVADVQEIVVKP